MHPPTTYEKESAPEFPWSCRRLPAGSLSGYSPQPVMGSVAPIVMSLIVFSGAAQFAALTVLTAGGGAVAAIAAGMLMNGRWLPMGLAVGPYLSGGAVKRAAKSFALVDSSFAIARREDGTYDGGKMVGATLPQAAGWVAGTADRRLLGGAMIADPATSGSTRCSPRSSPCCCSPRRAGSCR